MIPANPFKALMGATRHRYQWRVCFLAIWLLLAAALPSASQQSPQRKAKPQTLKKAKRARQPAQKSAEVTVWVNTKSGIYHYPGMRWYGNTRSGEFMKESAARAAGYRATLNGQ